MERKHNEEKQQAQQHTQPDTNGTAAHYWLKNIARLSVIALNICGTQSFYT